MSSTLYIVDITHNLIVITIEKKNTKHITIYIYRLHSTALASTLRPNATPPREGAGGAGAAPGTRHGHTEANEWYHESWIKKVIKTYVVKCKNMWKITNSYLHDITKSHKKHTIKMTLVNGKHQKVSDGLCHPMSVFEFVTCHKYGIVWTCDSTRLYCDNMFIT